MKVVSSLCLLGMSALVSSVRSQTPHDDLPHANDDDELIGLCRIGELISAIPDPPYLNDLNSSIQTPSGVSFMV